MNHSIRLGVLALVLVAVTYAAWMWMMADKVAQVKATITYHNQRLKSVTPNMVLKADDVSAQGFPFHSRVRIKQLSLSMIEGKETYLLRVERVNVKRAGHGVNLIIGTEFDALYAKDGVPPEHYHVVMSDAPGVVLSTDEPLPQAPYTNYRLFLPPQMHLSITLNGQQKEASFMLPPQNPLSTKPVPANVERPLWLMVSVLREAMVYNGKL